MHHLLVSLFCQRYRKISSNLKWPNQNACFATNAQCKACALNEPRAYQRSQAHFIYEQFYARSHWQVIPKRNAMRLLYIRYPWQKNRKAVKQRPIKRLNNTDSCWPSIVIYRIISPIISLIWYRTITRNHTRSIEVRLHPKLYLLRKLEAWKAKVVIFFHLIPPSVSTVGILMK